MDVQARLVFCWICLQVIIVSVLPDEWKVDVVSEIEALVKSCVVVPCMFQYPGKQLPKSRVRGMWHQGEDLNNIICHDDSTLVNDNFKKRTKLLGHLGQQNCSLEIDGVRDHDNGPFCFRVEIPTLDKYSFKKNCVTISMISNPPSPQLSYKQSLEVGKSAIFKCVVKHTCPSHPPSLIWSHHNELSQVQHKFLHEGKWEVESLLSFSPTEQDDHTDITCQANFHGQMTTTATGQIYVKKESDKKGSYIIIPMAAVVGTSILFGVVCFFMVKKYKRQIQDLQSRNANGVWSRLSRMSQRMRHRRNTDMQATDRSNNYVSSAPETTGFSKPYFPSPQCDRKDYNKSSGGCSAAAHKTNDSNIYGNF